jgi:crotonobetainyl-CoA:carnitine CoA-transferase CaiB-like acyl-CoA transferase
VGEDKNDMPAYGRGALAGIRVIELGSLAVADPLAQQALRHAEPAYRPGTMEDWGLGWDEISQLNPRPRHATHHGVSRPAADTDRDFHRGQPRGDVRDHRHARGAAPPGPHGRGSARRHGDHGIRLRADGEQRLGVWAGRRREERTGNVLPKIAPSNVYPTKGGGYLVIGANQDKVFARLAQVMGRPELCEDPRYATHAARSEHQQELDALVAAWTQGYGKQELWEFLNAAGVPAGPIYSIADIFEDPQFKARGMIRTLRDEEIGEVEQPAIVPRLSKTPGVLRWAGRIRPGKDNGEIFRRVLELSADEVSNLRRDGVI